MVRLVEMELRGEDWPGVFEDLSRGRLDEALAEAGDDLLILVWSDADATTRVVPLLEMLGNKTVRLTGRYRFRYDPPRTSSTGSGQRPSGDFHLYDGGVEIAAWDEAGKGRHGFKPGHPIPRKAYDAIVDRYPDVHGLRGRVLECCREAIALGSETAFITINVSDDVALD